MPTNFPPALDALTNPTPADNLNTPAVLHSTQHANANDAIEALEAKVGVDGSAVVTSHDYLIANHAHTGGDGSVVLAGAAGGDLSGTYPNPTVNDDSHTHTAATLPVTMPPSAHTHTHASTTGQTANDHHNQAHILGAGGDHSDAPANAANGFVKRNAANDAWEQVAYGSGANTVAQGNHDHGAQYFGINFVIDGGGSAITTGVKGGFQIPFACTLSAWELVEATNTSGAIKIDLWKDTYGNFPPDNADSITNGHEPEIAASGVRAQDTDLSDWADVTVDAGDWILVNVDSCTSHKLVVLALKVLRT